MRPVDPKAVRPRNVAVGGRELAIAWADGHESYYPFELLRRACPCAGCRERALRGSRPALRLVEGPSLRELGIARVEPVGAYALRIVWADGHDAGIYAFEELRRACPCGRCRGELAGQAREGLDNEGAGG